MSRFDADIVERLRWDKRYTNGHVPVTMEDAAKYIEQLRKALEPFAEYYDMLERNGRLIGHMLVSQQGDAILGHAGVQTRDLEEAKRSLAFPRS